MNETLTPLNKIPQEIRDMVDGIDWTGNPEKKKMTEDTLVRIFSLDNPIDMVAELQVFFDNLYLMDDK